MKLLKRGGLTILFVVYVFLVAHFLDVVITR